MGQGWRSSDLAKDFAMIKEGLVEIQVAKIVRKIDSYIVRENRVGFYQGTGWAKKIKDRWCDKEAVSVTDWDRKKMQHSTIEISQDADRVCEEAASHQEQIKRASVKSMRSDGGARSIWASFIDRFENYEHRAEAIFQWRRDGHLTQELREEIARDPDLFEFDALCDIPLYEKRGNV